VERAFDKNKFATGLGQNRKAGNGSRSSNSLAVESDYYSLVVKCPFETVLNTGRMFCYCFIQVKESWNAKVSSIAALLMHRSHLVIAVVCRQATLNMEQRT
jgi:hypothetical protein